MTATVNCPRCGQPVSMDDDWEPLDAFYPMASRSVAWHTACAKLVIEATTRARAHYPVPRTGTPAAETPAHLLPAMPLCSCGEPHPEGSCLL